MLSDPVIVTKVMSLLRKWGWETGFEKLRAEIEATDEEDKRVALQYFIGWVAAMQGHYAEALEQLKAVEEVEGLKGWVAVGRAFIALRQHRYDQTDELLDQAEKFLEQAQHAPDEHILRATIYHCRGALVYHQGETDPLPLLHEALRLYGKDSFGTGRVLDTLGMVYASRDNFHAAREFYNRALDCKQKFKDAAGIALSHGQLGRLYLDWGNLSKAAEHFKADLSISRQINDRRGEAQMYGALGQVALARGQREEAASWLDQSIQLSREGDWPILEGFARKDRAVVHLLDDEPAAAEAQIKQAQEIFQAAEFAEGVAHAGRVQGMVLRAQEKQEKYAEAERCLREALRYFVDYQEQAEACRTQLEIARTLRARGIPRPLVAAELTDALDRAERCRRDVLVQEVGRDLKAVDEVAYYRRIYERARGRDIVTETDSLLAGVREEATVLFLDVQNSTEYTRSNDPEVVMMTLNQMMAEFAEVLERHAAKVTAYLGDGFMAMVREAEHAQRAVLAALELEASIREFNRPREVLALRPLNIRIGIATGGIFIGNVGTYNKMDFTAIGTPANLAARIQSEAEPGFPCISRSTYMLIKDRFDFKEANPRSVNLKGLGVEDVWDVVAGK
jgi:class 3 adenylate cyclase